MVNHYQILGLEFGASLEQIRRAYREYVKHLHPDKHQNSEFFKERFQELQRAYEVLSDEIARYRYEQSFASSGVYQSELLRRELTEERQKSDELAEQLAALHLKFTALKSDYEALSKKQFDRSSAVVVKARGTSWRYAFFILLAIVSSGALYNFYGRPKPESLNIPSARVLPVTPPSVMSRTFPETFEIGNKDGYATATVELATGPWLLTEALIGNADEDHKQGAHATRLRSGSRLTMQFDAPAGVRRITIQTASYSDDGPSTWELWLSRDHGRTWQRNGQPQITSSPILRPAVFVGTATEPIRLEIRKTDNSRNRLNVDEINIETSTGSVTTATQ